MKKGHLLLIIAIFGILVTTFIIYSNLKQKEVNTLDAIENLEKEKFLEYSDETDCGEIEFTEYFVNPSYIQKVGQIGVVHGSGKFTVGRSYVSFKDDLNIDKIPIYAPTEMVLSTGSHYQNPALPGMEKSSPDYALDFDTGCGVTITFAHLKEVVDSIGIQLPEIKLDSRTNQLERIKFNAGDLIGYFIQGEGVAGMDFMVHDLNVVNQFANQARQEFGYGTNLLHAVCPYDFYAGQKKEDYYNLIGGAGGTLFDIKECGPISRDFPGTISGQWFLDKDVTKGLYDYYSEGDYGSVFPIVGDEERITFGTLGEKDTNWVYPINPTYKDPREVKEEHCYEFEGYSPDEHLGWVYLKLIDEETMDVVYSGTGSCPKSFPNEGKRYYR